MVPIDIVLYHHSNILIKCNLDYVELQSIWRSQYLICVWQMKRYAAFLFEIQANTCVIITLFWFPSSILTPTYLTKLFVVLLITVEIRFHISVSLLFIELHQLINLYEDGDRRESWKLIWHPTFKTKDTNVTLTDLSALTMTVMFNVMLINGR